MKGVKPLNTVIEPIKKEDAQLTPHERTILRLIPYEHYITSKEIEMLTGCHSSTIRHTIYDLIVKHGQPIGSGGRGYYMITDATNF